MTRTCERCDGPLEDWESDWCEGCLLQKERRITVDAAGQGFEYMIGLDDRKVVLVLDSAWADPEKVMAAFEAAGVNATILTSIHAIGVSEGGPQFVSVRNGDRGTLRDAAGTEVKQAVVADLRSGWVGTVELHGGRPQIVFGRYAAPMTFEPRGTNGRP